MHRFEAVQNLSGGADGRPYCNTGSYYQQSGGNSMFPQNKVYPPGSNVRLAGLLSSATPVSPVPGFEGTYYNRMGVPPQSQAQSQAAYNCNGGGSGGVIDSVGGYSQKGRGGESGSRGASPFTGMGYGSVGGGGAVGDIAGRYHPYQYQQSAYQQQQQQQQQRSGFLEQLLKNRGIHPSSGYQPYGRSQMMMGGGTSSSQSPIGGNQFYQQGYRGLPYGGGPVNTSASSMVGKGGAGGGVNGRNYFLQQPYNQQQQYYSWGRGGVGQGGAHYHHQNPYHGAGNIHNQSPFYHHPQYPRTIQKVKMDVDPEDAEHAHADVVNDDAPKSETRYRKNHERMNAIMNETAANCEPITVPLEKVNSLRHYARLLKEDLAKNKEDTAMAKESCEKRIQEFKESTARYHSDYKRLCQPIADEEYNDLVDKYYRELKEKMKHRQQSGETGNGGFGNNNEQNLIKQEPGISPSPPSCSGGGQGENAHSENHMAIVDDDYFNHPLFIDIPNEETGQNRNSHPQNASSSQQSPQQNQQEMYQGHGPNTGLYPSPPMNHSVGEANDLYYGGQSQSHGQHLQQQEQHNSAYAPYTPAQAAHNFGMGNLLIHAEPQQPPPPPHAPYLRAQHIPSHNYPHQHQQHYSPASCNPYYLYQQHQYQQSSIRNQGPSPVHQAGPRFKPIRPRPSEELREFLLSLVRNKYREDNLIAAQHQHQQPQVPQLQQQQEQQVPERGPSAGPEDHHSQSQGSMSPAQPLRFMSGGGIVEVKHSPPLQQSSHHCHQIYEDAATREWINSLATTASVPGTDDNHDEEHAMHMQPDQVGISHQEEDSPDDHLEIDLSNGCIDSSPPVGGDDNSTSAENNGHFVSGKGSVIAEILESPCLNDTAGEFESELRELEDVLHGSRPTMKQEEIDQNIENILAQDNCNDDEDEAEEDEV